MKRSGITVRVLIIVLTVIFIVACAVNPVTGKRQFVLMSESQEIAMGTEYDPQVVAQFGEYNDAELSSFIKSKTDEMGKISHRPNLEYKVKILDSPVVNAFAVPGGYIYLTRGILAQLNNEAELAGIIGHEMGHITARHSVISQSKQQLGTLILLGGMIVSEKLQSYAQYAMQGMQLLFLKFSRDDEREADRLGVEYSSRIGYDAHKMADFFQVLNKMSMAEEVAGVPTFLSTHPDPGARYDSVNKLADKWQLRLGTTNTAKVNEDSYLALIDGIVYGDDPRQGYIEGNTFYHPEMRFKFTFPSGWKFENQPSQVNFAPSDGKALITFSLSSGTSLDSVAVKTIRDYGLTQQESHSLKVNTFPAVAVLSKQTVTDQSSGTQSSNMILSYFIDFNGKYFVFHGVSSESDYKTYSASFESTMAAFSKLTDASKINVKPQRIIVKKVQKAATLSELFASYGVKKEKMEELALLNDMELTDRVNAGRLIKIIGE